MKKKVLIPLPDYGFDPTESAVPWRRIVLAGHVIVFATPRGQPALADQRMVTGQDLPCLLKKSLMAAPDAVEDYRRMEQSQEYRNPVTYEAIQAGDYDAILLPGGHDKGMRPYLESAKLQKTISEFFEKDLPVGAICHGTLLVARSKNPFTGKSVLWGRRTTGLTRNQEEVAYLLTRLWLGDYYRTYETYMADELISFLKSKEHYASGPGYPVPTRRDSDRSVALGFTVQDGNYLSARWPGDAHRFAKEFIQLLES